MRTFRLLACAVAVCHSACSSSPPATSSPTILAWRLEKGDRFTIETKMTGLGMVRGEMDVRATLAVTGGASDEGFEAELRVERLLMTQGDPPPMRLHFEGGRIREYATEDETFPKAVLENLGKPAPVYFSPTGVLAPRFSGSPKPQLVYMLLAWPVGGSALSGRVANPEDRWIGSIIAAREDRPELEYRLEGDAAEGTVIVGTLTPAARERHRLDARARSIFDPSGGHVKSGWIEINFDPESPDRVQRVEFVVRRR